VTGMPLVKLVNGEPVEMDAQEEAEFLASQADPSGQRARLKRALQQAYEARRLQGFVHQSKSFALDEASQRRLTSAYSFAGDAEAGGVTWPPSFAWRASDNSYLPLLTPASCKTFCRAGSTEAVRLNFLLFAKKDELAALADEALAGFDPDQGWT